MRLRAEVKVGLIVLLALITLGGVYWFFGEFVGGRRYEISAVFDDVLRLSRQADVRMAGVRIGMVGPIGLTLDKKARVTMIISGNYADAIPDDSAARITTGGLTGVGEYYVEIIPGSSRKPIKPGGRLRTVEIPKLDDLLLQVKDIVGGLKGSVASVNEILTSPKIRQSLEEIVENARLTTERTAELTRDVQEFVAANRPEIDRLVDSAADAAAESAAVIRNLRVVLEKGGARDIQQALASAGRTVENLEATTARLRALAEDKQIEVELRETIKSAHEAAKGAAEIVGKVGRIVGPRKRAPETSVGPVPLRGQRFDVLGKTRDANLRVDFNYTFPGPGDRFYRIGLFDLGESTRLDAQWKSVV